MDAVGRPVLIVQSQLGAEADLLADGDHATARRERRERPVRRLGRSLRGQVDQPDARLLSGQIAELLGQQLPTWAVLVPAEVLAVAEDNKIALGTVITALEQMKGLMQGPWPVAAAGRRRQRVDACVHKVDVVVRLD